MEAAKMLGAILGPTYLIIGLSVLLYMKPWTKVMDKWKKDHFGLMTMMFIHIIFGLVIVNMYNVWEWNIWLIVTLSGWAMLVKGAAYFLLPGSVIKSMMDVSKNAGLMYFGGLVATAAGAALTYYSYMQVPVA